MKSKRGSSAVFIMVILAALVSITLALIYGVRAEALRSRMDGIISLAGDSLMSEFDIDIQKEYGIFLLKGSDRELGKKLRRYIEYSTKDMGDVELESVKVSGSRFSTVNVDLIRDQILEYMKLDPYFRKGAHNLMTFAMTYAYAEKYILVLSHDEVVHLKCSMINKMPGLGQDKIENLKVGYSYMLGHPGKKLLFMGQEFGQYREWSEARELDWYLTAESSHRELRDYVKELLKMYKKYPALYATDHTDGAFEWINADDACRSIYSFIRKSPTGRNNLLFVINCTPVARDDYRVGVPKKKQYRLVLNSKDPKFGGDVPVEKTVYMAQKKECDGREFSFAYPLPAYGVAVFTY